MSEESVDINPQPSPEPDLSDGVDTAEEVRSVEEELTFVREQLLRTAAELQNYRRRTEQVRGVEAAITKSVIIEPFLGILDDLDRSLEASANIESDEASGDTAFTTLRDGVALVRRKFVTELEKMGVTVIPTVGEKFDEHYHEALMQQPGDENTEPGTILNEVQRGYKLGDRVLRHARVIVAA